MAVNLDFLDPELLLLEKAFLEDGIQYLLTDLEATKL
jgi:hypothetical protein